MKKIIPALIFAAFLSSCGGGEATDKQGELDKLLKQQAELNQKIRNLKEAIRLETGDLSGIRLVSVSAPEKTTFKHFVEVQGKVEGDESLTISARTQGTVTAVSVKEGDRVVKGQVMATMDDQIIRQMLAEVETQYELASSIYQKQKNLWDQKIGSEVQYLTAKTNKESLEKRKASVLEQLDLTRIKSPINGTVDNVFIKIGQTIAPGMPAISVVNLTGLNVRGEVGESYAGKINRGDEVTLFFPDMNKEISTRVGFASKTIQPLNRTFHVEVPLSGDVSSYRPNMVTVLKIVDYVNDSAFVLPVDLIQRSADGHYVMIAKTENGKMLARRQKVVPGSNYSGHAEILEGLTGNEQIIVNGYRDLNDGQELRTN
jgi:membrane fusion protein, multidrug efflux system